MSVLSVLVCGMCMSSLHMLNMVSLIGSYRPGTHRIDPYEMTSNKYEMARLRKHQILFVIGNVGFQFE